MNFITYADGSNSIFEIANLIDLDLKSVVNEAKLLKQNKLFL